MFSANFDIEHTKNKQLSVDTLVVSALLHRLRKTTGQQLWSIDSGLFQDQVTEDDRDLAREIRKHFSMKIIEDSLRGKIVSRFRADLATYLCTDGKTFSSDNAGMILRLPDFYFYDLGLNSVLSTLESVVNPSNSREKIKTVKLSLAGRIEKNNRSCRSVEFWFKSNQQQGYRFSIQRQSNQLLDMFDSLVMSEKSFLATVDTIAETYRDITYFRIAKLHSIQLEKSHEHRENAHAVD